MADIVLFCEGNDKSPDKKVLNKLKTDTGLSFTINPLGGKFSTEQFIEGYRHSGVVQANPNNIFVSFRDRDFDFEVKIDEDPKLIIQTKEKFISVAGFRVTLENYFIDSQFISDYLQLKLSVTQEIVQTAAQNIANYSAVRHAIGKIRGNPGRVGSTWTKGSGELPQENQVSDFDYCKNQGWARVVNKFVQKVQSIYKEDDYNQYCEDFRATFNSDIFLKKELYLVYFQGKDLQKAINRELEKRELKTISWDEDYRDKYIKATNFSDKFPDFKELSQRISKKNFTP